MERNTQPDQQQEAAGSIPSESAYPNFMYQSSHDNPIISNTPLQPIPGVPPPQLPTALMMTAGGRLAVPPQPQEPLAEPQYPLPVTEYHTKPQIQPQRIPKSKPRASESFEVEDNTTNNASRGKSWGILRFPWFRKKRQRKTDRGGGDHLGNHKGVQEDAIYYGGLMKAASPSSLSVEASSTVAMESGQLSSSRQPLSNTPRILQQQRQPLRQMPEQAPDRPKRKQSGRKGNKSPERLSKSNQHHLLPQHTPPPPPPPPTYQFADGNQNVLSPAALPEHRNTNKVFRNRSWISTSSKGSKRKYRRHASDEDSLADFDEAEWTPQDSAYGAAIPICGCVPKRIRQVIEATLIVFTVFALVYLVVTTSIALSEHKSSKHSYHNSSDTSGGSSVSAYDNGLDFDDDYYIEYRNDDDTYFAYNVDDDDDDDDYGNNNRGNNRNYRYNNNYNGNN